MFKLFDTISYTHVTETTNKTSEFLLHLDCLDPAENEQWASRPLPNTTGTFTLPTHKKWSSLTYVANFTLLHDCQVQRHQLFIEI